MWEIEDEIQFCAIFNVPLYLRINRPLILLVGDGVQHPVIDQKVVKFILIPLRVVHQGQLKKLMDQPILILLVHHFQSNQYSVLDLGLLL